MNALLAAIETADPDVIRRCAKAVLKAAFGHLYAEQGFRMEIGDAAAVGTFLVASSNFKGEK